MRRWVSEKDVAELMGLKARTLRRDREMKRGLPFCRLGRTVRYDLRDIEEYMAAHKALCQEKGACHERRNNH